MAPRPHLLPLAALLGLSPLILAQEKAGEAELGFQYYSLTNGNTRVTNAVGLSTRYREFLPNLGFITVNFNPATNQGRFYTGESFVELRRFPWLGNYWTFRGGDFRVPGRLLNVSFNNLYYPDITGRGAWVESSHGGRTLGFLYGSQTVPAGVRVPLLIQTPQTLLGGYYSQNVGERLVLGARFLSFANDLPKLKSFSFLPGNGTELENVRTATLSSVFTANHHLKFYSEAAVSQASASSLVTAGSPLSFTAGPIIEFSRMTLRANYVYQSRSYLPLLGYYLGDRRGPYAEFRVRPFTRLDLFASVSDYSNNLAGDPRRPTFHTRGESAGLSVQLPFRLSLSSNWSTLRFNTRSASTTESNTSEQLQVSLSRSFRHHGLRAAVREFRQRGVVIPQRQQTAEIADTFSYRFFTVGGQVRAQKLRADQNKLTYFIQGNGQVNFKRFSAYANVENANDLANRTVFATSTMATTVIGASVTVAHDWFLSMEAYRSRLVMDLNPQSIFALQGQGVFVPTILASMNQWSLYVRMTKRLHWGAQMPIETLSSSGAYNAVAIPGAQLKGTVEGFVKSADNRWAEGIPIAIDSSRIATTDNAGRFRFENVPEGAHQIAIALESLPAEFDPGKNREATIVVKPGKAVRADFDVVVVGFAVQGTVTGPKDVSLESILVRLNPVGRFTTPDKAGKFAFYNVSAGTYEVEFDPKSLPEHGILTTPQKVPVEVKPAQDHPMVEFGFDIRIPPKPVKKIILQPQAALTTQPK